jgi:hypothetical protein
MLALFALALAVNLAPPAGPTLDVIVFGADPCPAGEPGETVVCAREPEAERYRVPTPLRESATTPSPAGRSWASRVQELDDASSFTRPDGCSPVGSAGLSGCTQHWLNEWWLSREAALAGQQP